MGPPSHASAMNVAVPLEDPRKHLEDVLAFGWDAEASDSDARQESKEGVVGVGGGSAVDSSTLTSVATGVIEVAHEHSLFSCISTALNAANPEVKPPVRLAVTDRSMRTVWGESGHTALAVEEKGINWTFGEPIEAGPNPALTETVSGEGPSEKGDPGKGSTWRLPTNVELAVPASFNTPTAPPI